MSIPSFSWPRVLVEGTAVVLSILLAFAIDAAREERQQQTADIAQLRGLYDELATHRRLLTEATEIHRLTTDSGLELLNILATEPDPAHTDRISMLLNILMNFYRINAPFGALETAIASGTLSRMGDVELANRLAGWPTSIEDLAGEQDIGGAILTTELFGEPGTLVSLRDVYALRYASPFGRGTTSVVSGVATAGLPGCGRLPGKSPLWI
jgi:hypothetical protein